MYNCTIYLIQLYIEYNIHCSLKERRRNILGSASVLNSKIPKGETSSQS